MAARPIPTRLDDELIAALDDLASDMNLSRAATIRYVLARAVGQSATRATLVAEINEVRSRLHRQEGVIFERMMAVLYEALRDPSGPELDEPPQTGIDPIPAGDAS